MCAILQKKAREDRQRYILAVLTVHSACIIASASPPIITTHPSSMTTDVYTEVVFTCKARGPGPIDLVWKKDDSSLPGRHKVLVDSKHTTSTLIIQEIIGYDKGYYYCTATNYAGNTSSEEAYLDVTEIVIAPENITVEPGEHASFDCLAWSYGGLYYDWYIQYSNGTISYYNPYQRCDDDCGSYPIIHKQKLSITSYATEVHSFKVFNVEEQSNEGWYCCVAVNQCGNTTKCGWLEVNTTPKIIRQPSNITVRRRSYWGRSLTVAVTGKGPINYQWERYISHRNIWVKAEHNWMIGRTSPALKFRPAINSFEGFYRCIVSNDDGSVISNNAFVSVYGPPLIDFITPNTTVFEGSKVQLLCAATNDNDAIHELQVIWYKTSDEIKTPLKEKSRCHTCSNRTLNKQLWLDPVSHYDAGEYTCRAFNHRGSYRENSMFLTVEYAPIVTLHPSQSPYTVKVGGSLLLLCSAQGLPSPTVQWYRNGSPIGIPLPIQQFHVVPTLKQVDVNYTCVGRNNAGGKINTKSVSILVKIVPCCSILKDPKNGKVFISDKGDNAIFTCSDGYTVRGTSFLECNFDTGEWNTDPPTCTK
ncbi:roundabout homolog 2-like isoform X2 [Dysidea avara]|uniref:roundabout homolog 2-like isoform X2 n=1 Tax=Dysidea avara TaxID=196820 RepID=UPI00332DC711